MKRQKERKRSLREVEEIGIISLQNQLAKALSDYKANFGEEDEFYQTAQKLRANDYFPPQKVAPRTPPPPSYDDAIDDAESTRDFNAVPHSIHNSGMVESPIQGSDGPQRTQYSPRIPSAPQHQDKTSESQRRRIYSFERDNPQETYRQICARSWSGMTQNQKQAARILKITKNMWNTDASWPVEGRNWDELTTKQQSAAYRLGYDKSSWDADEHYTDYAPYKQRFSY